MFIPILMHFCIHLQKSFLSFPMYRKGDRYDGDWHMDKRHGDGDMKYMDGTIYEVGNHFSQLLLTLF